MYITESRQMSLFRTPKNFMMLSELDPNNKWVKLAELIPWDFLEVKYATNFSLIIPSRPAKPARMAIGTLIIKETYVLSDDEIVEMITENPYLQYFIGLDGFTNVPPMEASVLTLFRKRITPEMLSEINDYIIAPSDDGLTENITEKEEEINTEDNNEKTNEGTLILDATCVPSDITFPTDVSLLSQGRKCLEDIIDEQHKKRLSDEPKPRTYRQVANKEYMRFVRNRKPSRKLIRKTLRKQLGYVKRDLKAIEKLGTEIISPKSLQKLEIVKEIYQQQKHMYETKTHKIDNRIVSIHQPWVRSIVRGKATANA